MTTVIPTVKGHYQKRQNFITEQTSRKGGIMEMGTKALQSATKESKSVPTIEKATATPSHLRLPKDYTKMDSQESASSARLLQRNEADLAP